MDAVNKTFDLSFLIDFTHGSEEKLKYYIGIYLKTASRLFGELEDSIDSISQDDLYVRVHSLKPQTQYVGIRGLYNLLAKIEDEIKTGKEKESVKRMVLEAIELNKKGMAELEKYLDGY